MPKKVEMIEVLLEKGCARDLYDLLMGISVFNGKGRSRDGSPTIEMKKLVGAVRSHLLFISKYGEGKSHVIENDIHHFSYQDKFAEWLNLDAPGIYEEDLESLYNSKVR